MKRYFPLLLSKAGEMAALTNLTQHVKDELAPVIQVLPDGYNRVEHFALNNWVFAGNELFLDFSLCVPFDRGRTRGIITQLVAAGVNVVPVVQSNSDARYIGLLQTFVGSGVIANICVRFSNDGGGFIKIDAQLAALLGSIGLNRNHASILLDFGFVESHSYQMIAALAINTINGISHKASYNNIIVASSSFPENLGALTPAGRLYRLQRYEWTVWQTIIGQPGFAGIVKYGDYGTKHPIYTEANFQGSCSIKYTLPGEFIIYRGELSGNHPEGNGQYIIYAKRLVGSADYSGPGFSWGDKRIEFYAGQVLTDPKKKKGNSTNWVEISQNHHLTLLQSIL